MKKTVSLISAVLLLMMCFAPFASAKTEAINVTDYIDVNSGRSVSAEIQKIIDKNPNRTIYFPDGEYLLSSPLRTPADPRKSVDLRLDNYAVLRAADDFSGEALVMLGGKDPYNDTHTPGSNYSLTGGIIDCRGKTNAVTIDSGRETVVKGVSIKAAVTGLHIKHGANAGSSDADISDINIIGTGSTDSTGILVEGFDNTFTNIRIGCVYTGVHIKSAGNSLKNIHPLYYSDYTDYENSCGFLDEGGDNLYDYCYSDQFGIGFRVTHGSKNVYSNCFCYWYSGTGGKEVCFKADKAFNSHVTNMRIGFSSDTKNTVLKAGEIGRGIFDDPIVDPHNSGMNLTYKFYSSKNPLTKLRLAIFYLIDLF